MNLENTFEVPAAPSTVWDFLLDVEQVAPCMPGAELTDVVDDETWKGKVTVKLGPVSLAYSGTVTMRDRDDAAHRVVLDAKGTEMRGKGTASAVATATLEGTDGGGTRCHISTDLTIAGAAAQYGRGMIGDVSQRLTDQFAKCLADRLNAPTPDPGGGDEPAPPRAATPAKPVGGIRLGLWAAYRAVARFFRRVFGGAPRG